MLAYSGALWWSKKKSYTLLYEWLRVRHYKPVDDDDYWEDSEYTVKGYHKNSELNGNDKSEE